MATEDLRGETVLVTAGATRETIDPIRFFSNGSSGKMGYAIAAACARRGADVVLVSGPVDLTPPYGVERVSVTTSAEMREAVLAARPGAEAVFMVAAVSDYVPRVAASKIKRGGSAVTLTMDEGPDILSELGGERRERILIGFAAETESLIRNARSKLERKNLDYIVANDVSASDAGIDSDHNAVTILGRSGESWEIPRRSKSEIADAILDRIFPAGPDDEAS